MTALGGRRVVGCVEPRIADQQIRAGSADQDVITFAAIDLVVAEAALEAVSAGVADQAVVASRADHVLDVVERVALCMPAETGAQPCYRVGAQSQR